jgi:protein-L-isoaspartate(D-aspartate) O-methyltransferase
MLPAATLPFDVEHARFNMIEQQIRTWEVLDPKVLAMLSKVPREAFVPAPHAGLAFADLEIPLGHGHAMLTPKLEARLIQEATLRDGESIYEVGTGSGYMTALLAQRAGHVTTAELHGDLLAHARKALKSAGVSHVSFKEGDSASGPIGHDSYDLILITGSVPTVATAFFERLKAGGRLLAIEGRAPLMCAVRYDKDSQGHLQRRVLFETHATPLELAPHVSRFVF